MDIPRVAVPIRRPRFRRSPEPPTFRLTQGDVEILRQVARHRLIRSTHIAALVGRSLDRTNDRLMRLYHAGYIDRPRAQLDYYPTAGSGPMIYALADRGARLLRERSGVSFPSPELSRKNHRAGRPFIEHQIEIVNFRVALEQSVRDRGDLRLLLPEDLVPTAPDQRRSHGETFALRAKISAGGRTRESTVIPDFVFGLALPDDSRRFFMVEVDRGTMPVRRSDPNQTSFEGKMRTYLAAYVAKQHTRRLGWRSFRVLTVTTDDRRCRSMIEGLRGTADPTGIGRSLFWFTTFDELRAADPIAHLWHDGDSRMVSLL